MVATGGYLLAMGRLRQCVATAHLDRADRWRTRRRGEAPARSRLPIAALVTPIGAAALTGLAGIVAGMFAPRPQAG
jgi:hypothetical protein